MSDPLLNKLQDEFPVGTAVMKAKDAARPAYSGPDTMWELPPGPYAYATTAPAGDHPGKGHVYIVDANGRNVGVCWGKPDEKMAMAVMIIKASGGEPIFDWSK